MTHKISVYRNVSDPYGVEVSFDAVRQRVLSGNNGLRENTKQAVVLYQTDTPAYKTFKPKNFPAVTLACALVSRDKSIPIEQRLKSHSGLLVLDFDGVDIGTILADVSQRADVFFAFVSPSGAGVKVVVRLDPIPANALEHSHAWIYAAEAFSDVAEVDASGKDITRLCFLSYDPRAIYNPNAVPIAWSPLEVEPIVFTPPRKCDLPASGVSVILQDIDGSGYDNWCKVGMALYHLGYPCDLWVSWSKTQPLFVDGECQYKWGTFSRKDGLPKVGLSTLLKLSGRNPENYKDSEFKKRYVSLRPRRRT